MQWRKLFVVGSSVCVLFIGTADQIYSAQHPDDIYWSGDFGPAAQLTDVAAIQVFDSKLIVAGIFDFPDDPAMRNIAMWDGSVWLSMDSGINGPVEALTIFNGELIAGGGFSNAGGSAVSNVARWDGAQWQPLGVGLNSPVKVLTVWNGLLIAAGGAGGAFVAAWNGTAWSGLGSPGSWSGSSAIWAVTSYNSQLVAAGDFGSGGIVRAWGGSTWVSVGSATPFAGTKPASLAAYGSDLYMGVEIPTGTTQYALWKFNGSSWLGTAICNVPSNSPPNAVRALVTSGTDLILGGYLKLVGIPNDSNLFTFNGTTLTPLYSAVPNGINTYADFNGTSYIGYPEGLRHWSGAQWIEDIGNHPPQFGFNGAVTSLRVWNDRLVAAGYFTKAGSTTANYIASWNDTTWAPLASGLNGPVFGLGVLNGDLYVCGNFTSAGGVPSRNVAQWDGAAWHALDTGLTGWASICTPYQNELITVSSERIVGWNGFRWNVIADSINADVLSLCVYDNSLYAGGYFTRIAGVNASRVASWNGSTWSDVEGGIVGNVFAVYLFGGKLFVGGSFGQAGAVCANRLAAWDGVNWSADSTGFNEVVNTLTSYGTELIASGVFTTAGGDSALHIARWNGSVYNRMGSGLSTSAITGAEYHGALYLGGSFTTAGGHQSAYIARWTGPPAMQQRYSRSESAAMSLTDTCALDCCHGNRGNVECSTDGGIDISDLSRLIDYLYISLAPLCCPEAANVDGSPDNLADISDLTALIDFLYISFTPTLPCL